MLSKEERLKKRSEHKEKRVAQRNLRREIKKRAAKRVKRNYIACIAVCFIMVFIAGEYSTTTQAVSSYDNINVADLKYTPEQKLQVIKDMNKYDLTAEQADEKWGINNVEAVKKWSKAYVVFGEDGLKSKEVTFFGGTTTGSNWDRVTQAFHIPQKVNSQAKSIKNKATTLFSLKENKYAAAGAAYFDGLTNNSSYQFKLFDAVVSGLSSEDTVWQTIVCVLNFLFSFAVAVLVTNVLIVGERRFFLENRTYKKTKIGRLGFIYREHTLMPAVTMFLKSIYQMLWSLTIVGLFIKPYSYAMVPYICAENPNAKPNETITLSRKMMYGHKWELFKIHFTLIGWVALSLVTLGLGGVFYCNPYRTAVETEFYIKLRRNAIENGIENSQLLDDKYLDLELLEEQLENTARENGQNPDLEQYKSVFSVMVPEPSEQEKKSLGKSGGDR